MSELSAPPLRVGIAGYGLAGRSFHGRLVSVVPGARVVAVVTRNPQRRAAAEADHPGVVCCADVAAMLELVDLAVIATTTASHAAAAAAAIDAGVAVVVDKPLALTKRDAAALVDRAERVGVALTVFHNRRWDSDQLTLRRLIADGALGRVLRFESRFERWRPRLTEGKWRETLPAERGGGLLLDLGSHLVDQALTLFGPARLVYAEVDARRGGGDDDVFLALTHASGVRSHLWAGAVAAAPGPRLRVLGTAGAFTVDGLDGQEQALRAGLLPADPTRPWGVEPESRWGRLRHGDEAVPVPAVPGRWDTFYPAVVTAVRAGAPMPVDPHDAVRTLEVLEAARESAAAGRTVAFDGA